MPAVGGPLPLRIPIIDGESVDSWLEELARRHRLTLRALLPALGITATTPSTIRLIYGIDPLVWRQVEQVTGIPTGRLDSAVADPITAVTRLRSGGSRYCPRYLADTDECWQLSWRLNWTVACLRHRLLLLDRCLCCAAAPRVKIVGGRTPIPPATCTHTPPASRRRCGTDLTRATAIPVTDEILAVQHWIQCLITHLGHPDRQHATNVFADLPAVVSWLLLRHHEDLFPTARQINPDRPPDRDAERRSRASVDAALTATALVAARSILDGTDRAAIATLRRMLAEQTTAVGVPPRGMAASRWQALRTRLPNRYLRAADPELAATQRLRTRSMTPAARHPDTEIDGRVRQIPQMLWPDWAARLLPTAGFPRTVPRRVQRLPTHPRPPRARPGPTGHPTQPASQPRQHLPAATRTRRPAQRRAHPDTERALPHRRSPRSDRPAHRLSAAARADPRRTDHLESVARPSLLRRGAPRRPQPQRANPVRPTASAPPDHRRRPRQPSAPAGLPQRQRPQPLHRLHHVADPTPAASVARARRRTARPARDRRTADLVTPAHLANGLVLPGIDTDTLDINTISRLIVDEHRPPSEAARSLGVHIEHIRLALERLDRPQREWATNAAPTAWHTEQHAAQLFTRDFLEREYIHNGRSLHELAEATGIGRHIITRFAQQHGIPLAHGRIPFPIDPDWLREQYRKRRRSTADIARELGTDQMIVNHALHRFGIPARPSGIASHPHMITKLDTDVPRDIRAAVEGALHGWLRLHRFQIAMAFPSIDTATAYLGTHHSALVTQFQRLERDIGAKLYHRAARHKPHQPTPRGQALLRHLATDAVHQLMTTALGEQIQPVPTRPPSPPPTTMPPAQPAHPRRSNHSPTSTSNGCA